MVRSNGNPWKARNSSNQIAARQQKRWGGGCSFELQRTWT